MSKIAIIGAGPGGLLAAIALARRGVRSTVYEREGRPRAVAALQTGPVLSDRLTGHGVAREQAHRRR